MTLYCPKGIPAKLPSVKRTTFYGLPILPFTFQYVILHTLLGPIHLSNSITHENQETYIFPDVCFTPKKSKDRMFYALMTIYFKFLESLIKRFKDRIFLVVRMTHKIIKGPYISSQYYDEKFMLTIFSRTVYITRTVYIQGPYILL